MSVIAYKHMQIYAKDSQICVPKVPNSHRHTKPEGFVYFQSIEKPINGTEKIDMLTLQVQIWDICVSFSLISLCHLVKILNSSSVIV